MIFFRISHPSGQLGPCGYGAGWVIREAEINEVSRYGGWGRDVPVRRSGFEVGDSSVASVIIYPGATGHDVGVDVNGIDRIGDGEAGIGGEDFLDVGDVAFRAIADKDLIGLDVSPVGFEVMLGNCLA